MRAAQQAQADGFRTAKRVRILYRCIAPIYDLLSPIWRQGYRAAYRSLERHLLSSFPAGGRVLDLGCGTGANLGLLESLALDYGSYVGVDQSSAMLQRARRRFDSLPNAQFRQLDLLADPPPQGPFELVISTWVLEHLSDPVQVVQAASESLSDAGRMLLLFETTAHGWRQQVFGPVWRLFGAELVPGELATSFPGALTIERFGGPGPVVVVMLLGRSSGLRP